ncbi:hypothetical protein GCM10010365_56230 [Streptomyces poonensis]|uniref:Uncharacterized protein n=1 Tax=Streptomyces poonensis TaxID=68255 RepID=A0A918PZW7_9ACTN|nr:hypothetical protein GCM10010365_56230 [Streptomyces poonensis]GLJ93873.1 hypothetical protein GCM10017589_64900 [Streptomyces poonensis]
MFPDWLAGVAFAAVGIGALVPAAIMSIAAAMSEPVSLLVKVPALVGGLFTRWFHRWALFAGWTVGMVYGTAASGVASPAQEHFGGSSAGLPGIDGIGCIGLTALVLNVLVTVVMTQVLRSAGTPDGVDETCPEDYPAYVPGEDRQAAARALIGARAAFTVSVRALASVPARERRLTP